MRTLFFSLLLLLGCSTPQPKTAELPAAPALPVPLVRLDQHPCRGYCPAFQVIVFTDGRVDYEGLRFTKVAGKKTVQLPAAEVQRIAAAVERANLWQYPARIESGVADAPMTTLTGYRNGAEHAVTGSIDRPQPLLDLENTVKDAVEAQGIALREGVDPNAPAADWQRVTVTLRPELNAGNWIRQFGEMPLRLERRLGEANHWLLTYDPAEISEKSLLDLLRTTEGVQDAQPYRQ